MGGSLQRQETGVFAKQAQGPASSLEPTVALLITLSSPRSSLLTGGLLGCNHILKETPLCDRAPISRLSHMTGREAASTTAGDACQEARCCHILASGSWNSNHVLSLARDSDPHCGRRQRKERKRPGKGREGSLRRVSW